MADTHSMGTYGRNFDVSGPPSARGRPGRYCTNLPLPFGAPVIADLTTEGPLELPYIHLLSTPTRMVPGRTGILLYEYHGAINHVDDDPYLHTYADHDEVFAWPDAPFSQAMASSVQLVQGPSTVVTFTNTDTFEFLQMRRYPGRRMVAGTPVMGDLLTPGPGDPVGGYWQGTVDPTLAWMVVRQVKPSAQPGFGPTYRCVLA